MPPESVWVFDACAVIALLDAEPGAEVVEALRISLADCFALALAIREKGTLVTSDHHELDRIAETDLCPFRFIR